MDGIDSFLAWRAADEERQRRSHLFARFNFNAANVRVGPTEKASSTLKKGATLGVRDEAAGTIRVGKTDGFISLPSLMQMTRPPCQADEAAIPPSPMAPLIDGRPHRKEQLDVQPEAKVAVSPPPCSPLSFIRKRGRRTPVKFGAGWILPRRWVRTSLAPKPPLGKLSPLALGRLIYPRKPSERDGGRAKDAICHGLMLR